MNINEFTRWVSRDFPEGLYVATAETAAEVWLKGTHIPGYKIMAHWVPQRQPRSTIEVFVFRPKAPSFWQRLRRNVSVVRYENIHPIYFGPLDEESYREAMRAVWKDLLNG